MSKYDLFFAAVDESDGNSYITYGNTSATTNQSKVITRGTMTITCGAAASSLGMNGKAGTYYQNDFGGANRTVWKLVEDLRVGDTQIKLRYVEDSNNALTYGDTLPSGQAFLPLTTGQPVVDLPIDLRNAPSGKYSYIIGGHCSIKAEIFSNLEIAPMTSRLLLTDDLEHSPQEPNAGYAQGKIQQSVVTVVEDTDAHYPFSNFITAELDSGKIHWVRLIAGPGAFEPATVNNPRLFAMRYEPKLSRVIGGDGTTTGTSAADGVYKLEFTQGQIDALSRESVYAVVGQVASATGSQSVLTMQANTDAGLQIAITNCLSDTPRSVENVTVSGFFALKGSALQDSSLDTIQVSASDGVASAQGRNNALLGAFYCPSLQSTDSVFYNNQSFPEVLTTSFATIANSPFANVEKQQQAFMINTISPIMNAATGTGADLFSLRMDFPGTDGTARDFAAIKVGHRGQSYSPFHVAEVPRGSSTIAVQAKMNAATTANTGSFYSSPAICTRTTKGEYEFGSRRETLVELDTEIVWTDWTDSSGLYITNIDPTFANFDEVTGVAVDGVALKLFDGSEEFVAGSGQFAPIYASNGVSLWVHKTSAMAALDSPTTTVTVTVPQRFSVLGSDVKVPDLGIVATSLFATLPYPSRLVASPAVRRSLENGVSVGQVQLDNSDGELDKAVVQYSWTGRRARIYVGDPDKSEFKSDYDLVFDGEMDSPSSSGSKVTIGLKPTAVALTAPLDLGDVTTYVGKADANEYTQASKLPVIYGDALRVKALRVSDNSGSLARYAAMFGKQSFTPTKAYLNASDPDVAFTIPTNNDNSDAAIADSVIPGGAATDRLEQVYLDGRGLNFDHAGEICLDILSRFSKIPSEQINVSSFEEIDREIVLKLRASNSQSRDDAAKMSVTLPAETTVREALEQVLSAVGATLLVPSDGKLTAVFRNYDADNSLRILPDETESWCTFGQDDDGTLDSHPGFAGAPFATKFKCASTKKPTASGVVRFEQGGTHLFEAVAVAGSFNSPNDLKVEMTLPGDTTRTELFHQAVKIDTGYPVANTWDWTLISALVDIPESHCGTGTLYVTPRSTTAASQIDVYLDQERLVRVHRVSDSNTELISMRISPAQFSEVASKFNVNPLRADTAPVAIASMDSASAVPSEASNNRFTLSGSMSDAESSLGVATYAAGALGTQTVRASFRVQGLTRPPRTGEYIHVDMSRVPDFNYPSKLWRISEANQKKASVGVYDIVAYREQVARYGIF